MKTTYIKLLAIVGVLLFSGCSDYDTITNTKVSPVDALYSPEKNKFFNLGAQSSALFEWQAAKAEDNGAVLYDVAFDKPDGDFSNPIYVLPSDGKGFQNTLNLSFTDLNKIAEMAGIETKSNGKLKWTVLSSKGLDVQPSAASSIIEVERPGGYPTPDELFLTGTGTEGGDDIANAVPLKKTGATSFEVYTSLKPGDYHFVTRKANNADSYYINGSDLETDGKTTYNGDEKVYRMKLDFSDGSVTMATVEKIELWFPPLGDYLFDFAYVGNGTWKSANKHIEFKQESWGRDERYKFKFTLEKDGDSVEEWYGSVNADNQRPDANTAESYWYMVPVSDDFWSNSFKFDGAVDNNNVDIDIIFNITVPEYTHKITVL
ncbi:SusE domain-containing protein [Flavobacteriaceae bacterium F89]|uniref:SusE domain-containing protein n=1 Tax=Cerina litoralis TaxID=2874477 RepID=A0AAE3EXT2_9FLAO|nr:SusE domain-containing protein [Cerina litoralis]MCG2461677.1 SusE domain-containing protein [Cerina litoralis]